MKEYYFYLLLLFFHLGFSQNEKLLHGRIICDQNAVQGIEVLNLVSEKSTVSDSNGDFNILAKAEDILVFTSKNYEYKRKFLENEDIETNNLKIVLVKKPEELKEVVINQKLDALKLGILQKPAKEYTPAERKLKTATSLDPTFSAGRLAGGAMSLDPFLNWLSGRTKKLKAELSVERKEMLLAKISDLYEEIYYVEKLKIPKDYIKAFQYYVIYDDKLISNLKSKNKTLIKFRMIELAVEFNNLQEIKKIKS
jgi:hypothetical protein